MEQGARFRTGDVDVEGIGVMEDVAGDGDGDGDGVAVGFEGLGRPSTLYSQAESWLALVYCVQSSRWAELRDGKVPDEVEGGLLFGIFAMTVVVRQWVAVSFPCRVVVQEMMSDVVERRGVMVGVMGKAAVPEMRSM